MATTQKLYTTQSRFTEAELHAELERLTGVAEESIGDLIKDLVPTKQFEFLAVILETVHPAVFAAGRLYNLAMTASTVAEMVEASLRYEELSPFVARLEEDQELIVYTDVYEWISGSGNHVAYVSENRYGVVNH